MFSKFLSLISPIAAIVVAASATGATVATAGASTADTRAVSVSASASGYRCKKGRRLVRRRGHFACKRGRRYSKPLCRSGYEKQSDGLTCARISDPPAPPAPPNKPPASTDLTAVMIKDVTDWGRTTYAPDFINTSFYDVDFFQYSEPYDCQMLDSKTSRCTISFWARSYVQDANFRQYERVDIYQGHVFSLATGTAADGTVYVTRWADMHIAMFGNPYMYVCNDAGQPGVPYCN